ncbi:YccT family protein [Photobacterium minamisatsumaniensis]|uniref:YccT family protein n=1 Tax=Photobacterium minamisatsumaniensis TaxID=2910233 RepID=UPI003D101339
MKINGFVASGLIGLLSFPVAAEVTLKLPSEVNILSINGEEGKNSLMSFIGSSPDNITLPNGDNQIIYEIKKIFNKGSSQSEIYQSSPLVLSFNSIDSELVMALPSLRTQDAARRFDRSLAVELSNSSGSSIEHKNEKLPLDGFSINKDYAYLLAAYNTPSDKVTSTASKQANKLTSKQANGNTDVSSKLTVLQDVFNQLDDNEKQDFLTWAIKNLN